jgi:acetyl-CoA acetyltransferase
VTAGNASPLNDGAAALWVGDEAALEERLKIAMARQ